MKKQLIAIVGSTLLFFTSANAMEFGIGVSGSLAMVEASGSESESANTGAESSNRSKSVDNQFGTGSVFVDVTFDNGITIGGEIVPFTADVSDKTFSRTETSVAASGEGVTGSNTRTADAEVEDFRTLYVEYPVGSAFIKAGFSQIDVNTKETNLTNGGNYGNKTVDGYTVGLGFRGEMGGFFTKSALEHTNFDEFSISSGTTNTITADLDVTQVKFSIGKAF